MSSHYRILVNRNRLNLFEILHIYSSVPSLSPPSNDYKLVFPEKIGWNLCKLQITPGGQPHTVLCAKISNIKIRLTSSTDKKIHLADLHAFQFSIELNVEKEHSFVSLRRHCFAI